MLKDLIRMRFYGPVNPMGSCQARSDYLTTLLLGMPSPLSCLSSIVRILSPETVENISWSNSHERMLPTRWGSNQQPPAQQSEVHPTEPPRSAKIVVDLCPSILGLHVSRNQLRFLFSRSTLLSQACLSRSTLLSQACLCLFLGRESSSCPFNALSVPLIPYIYNSVVSIWPWWLK